MQAYFDPVQRDHDPGQFLVAGQSKSIPEVPERADRLLTALKQLEIGVQQPADHGLAPLARVHTPEYLSFLQTIADEWAALNRGPTVVPNIQPDRRDGAYPSSPLGRAGYHLADTSCPIVADTWTSAYASAQAAITAATAVRDGAPHAYALCRPPGHHAATDRAGGFCFANNSAIAVQHLRDRHARVATLDFDLHHGNGTQQVFYTRDDVLTTSVHVDPDCFYPFFWGHAAERGRADGIGYNLNLPLPLGSDDTPFIEALDAAIARIEAWSPGALVVPLGLDASADDPFGGLRVSPDGFEEIGHRIGAIDRPIVLVQEGGYLSTTLADNLSRFLTGFMAVR